MTRILLDSPFARVAAEILSEETPVDESGFLSQTAKKKRTRKTVAQLMREKGQGEITRHISQESRLSDQDLIGVGIKYVSDKREVRWAAAPYCWNRRGRLYEKSTLSHSTCDCGDCISS